MTQEAQSKEPVLASWNPTLTLEDLPRRHAHPGAGAPASTWPLRTTQTSAGTRDAMLRHAARSRSAATNAPGRAIPAPSWCRGTGSRTSARRASAAIDYDFVARYDEAFSPMVAPRLPEAGGPSLCIEDMMDAAGRALPAVRRLHHRARRSKSGGRRDQRSRRGDGTCAALSAASECTSKS